MAGSNLKYPISAMVVGFNEEKLLPECLGSISFCDDIHYTDLGSTDNSVKVAEQFAQHIYHRKPVPSCEMIQHEVVNYVKNDWVLFLDPDETLDQSLATQILAEYARVSASTNIGALLVPWQFYFARKRLRGTFWGGMNQKFLLVHKDRFLFDPVVHYGRKIKPGFDIYTIQPNATQTNVIHHYWMSDWKVFIRKHRRYLINEGIDKYNQGMRISFKELLKLPYKEFKRSFWTKRGYKDGFLGFALSVFWVWYQSSAYLSLYRIQRKNKGRS